MTWLRIIICVCLVCFVWIMLIARRVRKKARVDWDRECSCDCCNMAEAKREVKKYGDT